MLVNAQRIKVGRRVLAMGLSTREARAARLTQARIDAGFSTGTAAAESLGKPIQTYLAHENGSRAYDFDAAQVYGRRFGVTAEWLMTGREPSAQESGEDVSYSRNLHENLPAKLVINVTELMVIGSVTAGVWVEALEWPKHDWKKISVPIPSGYENASPFGLVVRGPSMDELYADGTIVVCVKFMDIGRKPRHGERIVALRHRPGEVEAMVKEFRIDGDGVMRLWPRSSHPQHRTPIDYRPDDQDLQIAFLVIGSFRPEA